MVVMRADAASGKILTRGACDFSSETDTPPQLAPPEAATHAHALSQLLIKAAYFHLHVHSEVAPLACFSCWLHREA